MPTSSSNEGQQDDTSLPTVPVVVRWGILGTGAIATDMVQILQQLPACAVVAIGSRSSTSARRFGTKWSIPATGWYASYEEVCHDPLVDVVYVATPSLRHPDDCRLALRSHKAVLCEKSMAPTYHQAQEVLAYAQQQQCLFVHGVWSRFFPVMHELRSLITSGTIGTVYSARASFGQNDGAGSCSALLETGIYCAQFLQWVLSSSSSSSATDDDEQPTTIVVRGACRRNAVGTELDEHVTAVLEFPQGKMGTLECSLGHCTDRSAAVYGTHGIIEIPFPFWCPTQLKVTTMTGPGSQTFACLPPTSTSTNSNSHSNSHRTEDGMQEFPLPAGVRPLQPVVLAEESSSDQKETTTTTTTSATAVPPPAPAFTFVNSEGLTYEAAEVNRCVREGLLETPLFTSDECLDVMRIITEIDTISRRGTNE